MTYPTLSKAPIVEAILEVQIAPIPESNQDILSDLCTKFASKYSKKETLQQADFEFKIKPSEGQKTSASIYNRFQGFRCHSDEDKSLLQFRLNGFAFNKLAPYKSWDDTEKLAQEGWKAYSDALPDIHITNIGVRYINRIEIPFEVGAIDLDKYFRAKIAGPPTEGIGINNFLMQAEFTDKETSFKTVWALASLPTTANVALPIILDIAVSAAPNLLKPDVEQIWKKMRNLKNRLFFDTFTEKGISLFI